jgi:hypothetical protein
MSNPSMFKTLEEAINTYEQEYEQRPKERKLYYINDSFIQVFPEFAKQSIISRIKEKRNFAISVATQTTASDTIQNVKEWLFYKYKGNKVIESASKFTKEISERISHRTGAVLNIKDIKELIDKLVVRILFNCAAN